jgi:hypothetical protein
MYLRQPTFRENFEILKFDIFCKKGYSKIKRQYILCTDSKKSAIYEKLSMQKVTSDFNRRRPFAQNLGSQNSKGKNESRKNLDFIKKEENLISF